MKAKWSFLWLLIALAIVAIAVTGCSGPAAPVTVTPDANDSARQAAYSAYVEKSNATAQYRDVTGQISDRMQYLNYSDVASATAAVDNATDELDGYLTACRQAQVAAYGYRSYLDPGSDEYRKLTSYGGSLNKSINSAQALRSTLTDYHQTLYMYDTWQHQYDALQAQFDAYKQTRYGDEMRQWLQDIRPQVDEFLSYSNSVSSSIGATSYETPAGSGKDSLTQMKSRVESDRDSYKQRYNALVTQYNATFAQVYGSVAAI
jgi:hypothetical protein